MNRTNRTGTVAHRCGNTFHRLCPDISGREDSRAGRFERQRLEADVAEIAVREDEPLGIELHETLEPTGGGRGTDEGEESDAGLTHRNTRLVVRDRDILQPGIPASTHCWLWIDHGCCLDRRGAILGRRLSEEIRGSRSRASL